MSTDVPDLDIRHLVAVAAVADIRNFRLAADQLHTSQPTLSRLIGRVEQTLGIEVFRRGWSGAETTREGDLVCQFARSIRQTLGAAEVRLFAGRRTHPRLERSLGIGDLRIIDAARRTGGATAAALELGCSQPVVSRTLTRVQQHLGLPLFQRSGSGLRPLPAAQELGDLHGRIAAALRALRDQLQAEEGQLAGRVAIGILPFSGQVLIPRVFARLSEDHPRARLVLVPGTYPGLVSALRRGEIEGLVGIMRKETCPADLIETPLSEEEFTIFARKDHPVHVRASRLEDLRDERWLLPPYGSPVRAYMERLFGQHEMMPQIQTCEIQFFSAVEQMVAESNAIAVQTYSAAGLRNLRPDLRKVEVPLPGEPALIGLTTLRGAREEPVFAEFRRLLADAARAWA